MSKICILAAIAFLLTAAGAFATQTVAVQGEYLEARSVSVYAGACHIQSEFLEGGKEATLVWNIHRGKWDGISLDGLTVVAVVTAKKNLAVDSKTRRSVLYLDANATSEQCAALTDLITTKRRTVVGEIVSTQIVPITFTRQNVEYELRVSKVLSLSVSRYPCQYCTQPHEVWYKPLEQINAAIAGKSKSYRYKDTVLPVMWDQGEPVNNVLVGSFTM